MDESQIGGAPEPREGRGQGWADHPDLGVAFQQRLDGARGELTAADDDDDSTGKPHEHRKEAGHETSTSRGATPFRGSPLEPNAETGRTPDYHSPGSRPSEHAGAPRP